MPAGTGLQFSARELQSVAKAPSRWRLMTLSPGLNCVTPSPTATISPAASLPGTKGGSGRNWYLPASISTSTYCTPRAAIFTCTSPGPGGGGSGMSRNAKTSGPPKASQTTAFICAFLSPIVEHKEPGPAVAGLVRAVHRDTLDVRAEAAREHRAVGFFARGVDPGDEGGHAGGGRDPGAGVEQRGEAVGAPGARAHRAEFDTADAVAGLARRSQMADRKPRETAVAIPHKHRVAQIAGEHRADLGAQIEPVVNLIAQLAGRAFHLGALTFGQLGIARR